MGSWDAEADPATAEAEVFVLSKRPANRRRSAYVTHEGWNACRAQGPSRCYSDAPFGPAVADTGRKVTGKVPLVRSPPAKPTQYWTCAGPVLNGGERRPVEDLPLPSRVLDGDFCGWLRAAMRDRGMSQRALAMRTGVSHSTISRLLSEDRTPSLDTAVAIIRVLEPRLLRVPVSGRTCPACARPILVSTG